MSDKIRDSRELTHLEYSPFIDELPVGRKRLSALVREGGDVITVDDAARLLIGKACQGTTPHVTPYVTPHVRTTAP